MTRKLQLAAAALLFGAAAASAQIHSPQVTVHRHHPGEDLSWLWQYTEPAPSGLPSAYRENDLRNDARFKPFLKQNLTAPQTFWGDAKPLPEVALDFLSVPGDVLGENDRYLTATGCVEHFCPDRGLLWVDLGLPKPLVVFAATDWITENRATDDKNSTYTMWVFSNQTLDLTRLPAALIRSIHRWTNRPSSGSTDLQNITRVFLVDPDGTPHPLSPSAVGANDALPGETGQIAAPQNRQTAPKAKP